MKKIFYVLTVILLTVMGSMNTYARGGKKANA